MWKKRVEKGERKKNTRSSKSLSTVTHFRNVRVGHCEGNIQHGYGEKIRGLCTALKGEVS